MHRRLVPTCASALIVVCAAAAPGCADATAADLDAGTTLDAGPVLAGPDASEPPEQTAASACSDDVLSTVVPTWQGLPGGWLPDDVDAGVPLDSEPVDDCVIGAPDWDWEVQAHCRGTATWPEDGATLAIGAARLSYSIPLSSRDLPGREPTLQPGMEVDIRIDATWRQPSIDTGSLGLDVWELRDTGGRLLLGGWNGRAPDWVVDDFSVELQLAQLLPGEPLAVAPGCGHRYEEFCSGAEVAETRPALAFGDGDSGNGSFVLSTTSGDYAVRWAINETVHVGEAVRGCSDLGFVDTYAAEFVRLQ